MQMCCDGALEGACCRRCVPEQAPLPQTVMTMVVMTVVTAFSECVEPINKPMQCLLEEDRKKGECVDRTGPAEGSSCAVGSVSRKKFAH